MHSYAKVGLQCSTLFSALEAKSSRDPHFENGHNVPLKNVMLKMKDYENSIQEFVNALAPRMESKYLKDDSQEYRNQDTLKEIIEISKKYEKVLTHLVEHSDHLMMSPRIQMIPAEKRSEFIQKYKQSYIDYLETYKKLVAELESYQEKDPSDWDSKSARDILMQLHVQMGAAHNRF